MPKITVDLEDTVELIMIHLTDIPGFPGTGAELLTRISLMTPAQRSRLGHLIKDHWDLFEDACKE